MKNGFIKKSLWYLLFIVCGGSVSCTPASETQQGVSKEAEKKPALLSYQPHKAKITINGQFSQFDSLDVKFFRQDVYDLHEPHEQWVVPASGFELTLDSVANHEVVYLSVLPKGDRKNILYDLGLAPIPLWVRDGAVYELELARLSDPITKDTDYFSFSRHTNQEQVSLLDFYDRHMVYLDQYSNRITMDIVLGRHKGQSVRNTSSQAREEAERDYLLAGKSDAASLFIVFKQNDHRENQEAYRRLRAGLPQDLQFSKYGIDLHNRLESIANPPDLFDIATSLKAISAQVIPFDPGAYDDKDFWLMVFWNSRDHSDHGQVAEIMNQFATQQKADTQLLFFSLDPRLSRWRLLTGELGLEHSYFIRAEQRQNLLNDWYITTTPRLILIDRKGNLIDGDLQLKDLSGLSGT